MPGKHHNPGRWLLVLAVSFLLPLAGCQPAAPTATVPVLPTAEASAAPTAEAPIELPDIPEEVFYIHPKIILGQINPLVYGVNHGPWAVVTEKTLPLAQEAGITLIRFPGGNWGDENDLQPYQIDQFASLASQLGSQVSLNVRLHRGTPAQAAELVRYANLEKNYGIRYWGIGNEPTLFVSSRAEPDYGVERFNREWRAIAEAMKAVDPSILLIGPELHQFGPDLASTPKDLAGKDWMTEFLKANGDLVDVVSIHRYPFPQGRGGRAATVEELAATSAEWDAIIPYLRSVIEETTGRSLPIAVTEVNSHWSNAIGGEATPDSFYNAIWWADSLGRMIANQVEIVNYFTLHSNASIGGYGLLSRAEARPTYYVYRMFKEFGDTLVFAGTQDARVGIYAALDGENVLTVMLVNLSESAVQKPVVIAGEERSLLEVWRFDQEHQGVQLAPEQAGSLEALLLPGQSVTLLKLK